MNNGLPGRDQITQISDTYLSLTHALHRNPHLAVSVSEIELRSFLMASAQPNHGLPGPIVTAGDQGAGGGERRGLSPWLILQREPCGAVAPPGGAAGATGSALGTECTEGLGAGRSE